MGYFRSEKMGCHRSRNREDLFLHRVASCFTILAEFCRASGFLLHCHWPWQAACLTKLTRPLSTCLRRRVSGYSSSASRFSSRASRLESEVAMRFAPCSMAMTLAGVLILAESPAVLGQNGRTAAELSGESATLGRRLANVDRLLREGKGLTAGGELHLILDNAG